MSWAPLSNRSPARRTPSAWAWAIRRASRTYLGPLPQWAEPEIVMPSFRAELCRVGGQAGPVGGPVVEQEQTTHSEPASDERVRGGLHVVGGDHAGEVALAGRVVAIGLAGGDASAVLGQPDVGARGVGDRYRAAGARLSTPYLVRRARRGVRADDADHAAIAGVALSVRCALGSVGGHGERHRRVVAGLVAEREAARSEAALAQDELDGRDDLPRDRVVLVLQRQVGGDHVAAAGGLARRRRASTRPATAPSRGCRPAPPPRPPRRGRAPTPAVTQSWSPSMATSRRLVRQRERGRRIGARIDAGERAIAVRHVGPGAPTASRCGRARSRSGSSCSTRPWRGRSG